jgi:surface antigen
MQKATRFGQALVATVLTGTLTIAAHGGSQASLRIKHPLARQGGAKSGTRSEGRGEAHNARYVFGHGRHVRYAHASYSYGGLQCVPFARAVSGIELKGNAANWWAAADGVYQRGAQPESGSVLNFRATGGMRLGHVAVVTAVLDARHIEVEQANWYKGSISRNTPVVDVSPDNDWTQVRVAMGTGTYGSTYPTYGFIYDRPDTGTMVANAHPDATLQTASVRDADFTEVAEAPADRMLPIARTRHSRHGRTQGTETVARHGTLQMAVRRTTHHMQPHRLVLKASSHQTT